MTQDLYFIVSTPQLDSTPIPQAVIAYLILPIFRNYLEKSQFSEEMYLMQNMFSVFLQLLSVRFFILTFRNLASYI